MNDPNLYQKSNSLQIMGTVMCLDEYASKIKWKSYSNILDIGCGDGSVTSILKKYIPTNFKLLGCDMSEDMVSYANDHYCNEQTSFTVLDIEGDLPKEMKGKFDHVFSFYALHWIINQERAFNNIYNLLTEGGECLIIFVATTPIFDAYRILARNNKWSEWFQDVERYISPYHDSKDPEKDLQTIVEKTEFMDIKVERKDLVFVFDNMHSARNLLTALNPFKIPEDKYEDFMNDYLQILRKMPITDKSHNNYDNSYDNILQHRYSLLVFHARKPTQNNSCI